LKVNVNAFNPLKFAKPIDKQADAIKETLKITDEEKVKSTKTLLESIKTFKSGNGGKISLDLFNKIGELSCCDT